MKEEFVIPNRLKLIASFLSTGTTFADIGSDHALLPIYVCLNDKRAKAIAGEINEGPFNSAQNNIKKFQLKNSIDVRLGSGLSVIKQDEVEEVVIAGMGGSLISSILEEGKDILKPTKRIVTQPNIQARKVRKWADLNSMHVSDEMVIEENKHFYEIIAFEQGLPDNCNRLSTEKKEKQYLFGPLMLKKKSQVFIKKWTEERNKLSKVILQMKQAKDLDKSKIKRFEKELQWIEEVLS